MGSNEPLRPPCQGRWKRLPWVRRKYFACFAIGLSALIWFRKFADPTGISIPKIGFTYSLCLGATLFLYAPPIVRATDLVILWAMSWLLTMGVYQFLPGR